MIDCTGKIDEGIYNCFGTFDKSMCFDCIHNSKSEDEKKVDRFVDFRDRIDVLYKYLKGEELPEGVTCKMPKLSPNEAFSVIWFLQEILHVLPDNIEQCDECKELFDTDCSGYCLDDQYINKNTGKTLAKKYWGDWCDGCVPDIEFEVE